MELHLQGKNALVCGSTQGIGRAIAETFAAAGACVTLLARNPERLKAARAQLPTPHGQRHSIVAADFSAPDDVERHIREHMEQAATVYHILVHNTGGPPPGKLFEAPLSAFDAAFRQHLWTAHILMQALLPGMRAEGYGRILLILSTSVRQPIEGLGISNTVRAALASWMKTLSVEVAPWGITVNAILPGSISTQRLQKLWEYQAQQSGISVEEVVARAIEQIPAGRIGQPHDIAALAAFLASPAAAYITGVCIPVDGGRTRCL
ncbi:MAG: SDR family oxidoreductase [Candidatus Kapabacteria bacterium]|nr:SDR family oxidoreductase [Candidatus Kapabacteria bacterium]MCS7169287.1 SDR family oxidoreductase [Candidatus Kapabacteria bacterium]MDW7997094.1 SDR family oxidoreductase [Bacteroidota bacterium]MDW8225231.1 SDR family oxidoreductase [Bacteroidota bacterium]